MLDQVDIFHVTLTISIGWEFKREISDLICTERDKAIERANRALEAIEIGKNAKYDSISVSVKAGVLGLTGFETEIYAQRITPEPVIKQMNRKATGVNQTEQKHDISLESIIKETEMSRHALKGISQSALSQL